MLPDHPQTTGILTTALALAALCLAQPVMALPEDAKQIIEIEGPAGSSLQSSGWIVLKGTAANPAKIKQGTLLITGLEIRLLQKNNELQSATATGSPARFQQQPAKDKALIQGSGRQITLNNAAKLLTITTDGELSQEGNLVQSSEIEYHIDTSEYTTGPMHMSLQPKKDKP